MIYNHYQNHHFNYSLNQISIYFPQIDVFLFLGINDTIIDDKLHLIISNQIYDEVLSTLYIHITFIIYIDYYGYIVNDSSLYCISFSQ